MPVSKHLLHALLVACPTPPGDSSDPPSTYLVTNHAGWLASLLCATCLTLGGCSPTPSESGKNQKPAFATKATPLVFGNRFDEDPIHWLDNRTILLPAHAGETRTDANGKTVYAPYGIFTLDTDTNRFTRHADLERPDWFMCFNRGFIAYSIANTEGGENKVVRAGEFGMEKTLPDNVFWKLHPELKRCNPEQGNLRPEHVGAEVWHLQPEHGYLYVGRPRKPGGEAIDTHNQNDVVLLVRPDNGAPISLPILAKELSATTSISYAEHAQKYVIRPGERWTADVGTRIVSWPKGHPIRLYVLSLDGSVETIEIPYGNRPSRVFLTKQGLFLVSSNTTGAQSRTAGGWLLRNGKQTKLFDHMPEGAGVSPDGCRIAYAYNDYNRDTREYVQIVDLCQ